MKSHFYYKDKKQVVPVLDQEKNKQARKKLDQIFKTKKELVPDYFGLMDKCDAVCAVSSRNINK